MENPLKPMPRKVNETHIGHGRVVCVIYLVHECFKTYFHRL